MDDGAYEVIIPGLPNDLALRCLAKISHGYHGVLECVSKRWRDTMRSLDYARLKASEGWCGNWLFVSTAVEVKGLWDAYDPDADRWHTLPRMPRVNYDRLHSGFSGVTVCKKFLVIGGSYASCYSQKRLVTNEVMLFDPFKKLWSRAASMQIARTDFASTVISGKVYVAGGSSSHGNGTKGLASAEVYDPCMNRWEDLPPMPFPLMECFSVSYGGQFHVVGKKGVTILQDTYVIYDPVEQRWHIMEDLLLFSKTTRFTTAILNDRVSTILEEGTIRTLNTDQRTWSTLGVFPVVFLPDHIRPLRPSGYSFVGFCGCLYVVGGLVLKYDSNTQAYVIVKLNSTRICDPTKSPMEWQDVKAMPRQSCESLTCATMEE